MTDPRLEQLRRAVELGEPGARRSLLAGRVRVGELPRERVELAAILGDGDAREVLGRGEPGPGEDVRQLDAWDREVVLRVGAAALRHAGVEEPCSAFDRWVLCPCAEHWRQAAPLGGLAFALMNLTAGGGPAAFVLQGAWRNAQARGAIVSEVAPWALLERDPLRERVEAAGQA